MTRRELIPVIENVQSAETRLRHVVQSEGIYDLPETVVAAEVLEALAPLVAVYQAVCAEHQRQAPAAPWPPGTIVWIPREGYGLVVAWAADDAVVVRRADEVQTYPADAVVWMSAPSPVTTALLAAF